jgi:hypothetical protein
MTKQEMLVILRKLDAKEKAEAEYDMPLFDLVIPNTIPEVEALTSQLHKEEEHPW